MISKCANPDCSVPLRYLRHGRIFRFDVPSLSFEAIGSAWRAKMSRKVAHFWLCGHCCQTMTLIFDPVIGAKVHALEPFPVQSSKIPVPLALPPQLSVPAVAGHV